MNFELNKNLGNWLTQLNGKVVDKIVQVNFNNDKRDNMYLPWLFFVTFLEFNKFLEIEGDFDGDHIKINIYEISVLNQKFEENNLLNEPSLWRVYETRQDEIIGKLLKQRIQFIEFGIDKDEFKINTTLVKGQKDVFTFIRFVCEALTLTIFEGSGTGLSVSDNPDMKLGFEETFDTYDTRINDH